MLINCSVFDFARHTGLYWFFFPLYVYVLVWGSVIAKNQGQENAILCFIKKSIGYLIIATWFSFVSGLVGTGWSWWVARWMCFPVSDDYLICCCSWRKEELCSICPVCRLLPGHVCPLLADFTTVSDSTHRCMETLTKISSHKVYSGFQHFSNISVLSLHLYLLYTIKFFFILMML